MPRTLSEQHKAAMQAGKEAASEARRAEAVSRVGAYRSWAKRDADITRIRRAEEALGRPLTRREPMPALPSDYDFKLADGDA